MKRQLISLGIVTALCGSAHADQWLTYGTNAARSGFNPTERFLSKDTVPQLKLAWKWTFSGPLLTQPVYASGVPINDGSGNLVPTDLVYAADMNGEVVALNAKSGVPIWTAHVPSRAGCEGAGTDSNLISTPVAGVAGTPTIDPPNNRMFLVAGNNSLYALALDTGLTLPGYPLQVFPLPATNGGPLAFGSPTYDSINGFLYIASAGECEVPNYQGEIVKVAVGTDNTTTPSAMKAWFATTENELGGGIWGPGGVSIDPDGPPFAIYAATGNSYVNPENITYAEHVIKFDGDLNVVAANGPALTGEDADFGATPLPFNPPGCPPLLAVMNKYGKFFVYSRDGTSISNGPLQVIDLQLPFFIGIPVYDPQSNQLFFGSNTDSSANPQFKHGLIAMGVQPNCSLLFNWVNVIGPNVDPNTGGAPSIPPTVANGVVYYSSGTEVDAVDTAGNLLWKSDTAQVFAAPTVVNGLLLVSDFGGTLSVFTAPIDPALLNNPDMELSLLFQAAFGRLPDSPGLAFWKNVLTQGLEGIQQIAQQFADSPEFAARLGAPDNATFVNQMYQTALGRGPDASGAAFWNNSLALGATRGDVLIGFAESQENLQLHGPGIIDGGFLGL